jgi:hypothetical protein
LAAVHGNAMLSGKANQKGVCSAAMADDLLRPTRFVQPAVRSTCLAGDNGVTIVADRLEQVRALTACRRAGPPIETQRSV